MYVVRMVIFWKQHVYEYNHTRTITISFDFRRYGLLPHCMTLSLCYFTVHVFNNSSPFTLRRFITYNQHSTVFYAPPFKEWWRGIKCYPSPCMRSSVRPCVRPLSKFGVRSITFEILHRFNSNMVCGYIISKHRSSSI